jgi:hypothetical protein
LSVKRAPSTAMLNETLTIVCFSGGKKYARYGPTL